jgi:Icc-related predicted phosphoesterase
VPLFGRARDRRTRIFYASDVHGSERTWRKFLNAAKFYDADVLIMGGDVIGKLAIPIITGPGGSRRATIHGRIERLETDEDVAAARERIANLGFYAVDMDEDEYTSVKGDPAAVEALWTRLAQERMDAWIGLAEQRLSPAGVKCYVSGGNDDLTEVMDALPQQGTDAFIACEGRAVPLDDDHVMVSLPYVNPTPWQTPREAPEEGLRAMIENLVAPLGGSYETAIFNFHAPPVDSSLDTCPKLDDSTDPPRPIVVGGQQLLYGAGSVAVREAVERRQPLLGLHGHIHESAAITRIGRTLCVNPGSQYGEGVLRGALITIEGSRVTSYQLTMG